MNFAAHISIGAPRLTATPTSQSNTITKDKSSSEKERIESVKSDIIFAVAKLAATAGLAENA